MQTKDSQIITQEINDRKPAVFFVDGGVKNNGDFGNQKAFICVTDDHGKVKSFKKVGDKTNNEAELLAILQCLTKAPERSHLRCDSLLAVNLVNGRYKTKIMRLHRILTQIWGLNKFFTLTWIPREENLAGWVIQEREGV